MKYLKSEYKITDDKREGRKALQDAVWTPVTQKEMGEYLKLLPHGDGVRKKRRIIQGSIGQVVFTDKVVSFKRV